MNKYERLIEKWTAKATDIMQSQVYRPRNARGYPIASARLEEITAFLEDLRDLGEYISLLENPGLSIAMQKALDDFGADVKRAVEEFCDEAPQPECGMDEKYILTQDGQRKAAAALLIRRDPRVKCRDVWQVLMLERTKSSAAHHGWRFELPGGAMQRGDGNLLQTALRALYEEVGIPRIEEINVSAAQHVTVRTHAGDNADWWSAYYAIPQDACHIDLRDAVPKPCFSGYFWIDAQNLETLLRHHDFLLRPALQDVGADVAKFLREFKNSAGQS